jgi:hypothetical protein
MGAHACGEPFTNNRTSHAHDRMTMCCACWVSACTPKTLPLRLCNSFAPLRPGTAARTHDRHFKLRLRAASFDAGAPPARFLSSHDQCVGAQEESACARKPHARRFFTLLDSGACRAAVIGQRMHSVARLRRVPTAVLTQHSPRRTHSHARGAANAHEDLLAGTGTGRVTTGRAHHPCAHTPAALSLGPFNLYLAKAYSPRSQLYMPASPARRLTAIARTGFVYSA